MPTDKDTVPERGTRPYRHMILRMVAGEAEEFTDAMTGWEPHPRGWRVAVDCVAELLAIVQPRLGGPRYRDGFGRPRLAWMVRAEEDLVALTVERSADLQPDLPPHEAYTKMRHMMETGHRMAKQAQPVFEQAVAALDAAPHPQPEAALPVLLGWVGGGGRDKRAERAFDLALTCHSTFRESLLPPGRAWVDRVFTPEHPGAMTGSDAVQYGEWLGESMLTEPSVRRRERYCPQHGTHH